MKGQPPTRFTSIECPSSWEGIHTTTTDDLAGVCFPGKLQFSDRCFHRGQLFALESGLLSADLNLQGKTVIDVGCGPGRRLQHVVRGPNHFMERTLLQTHPVFSIMRSVV